MHDKSSKKLTFVSPRLGSLSAKSVIEEIAKFVFEDNKSDYRLIIGTDSHIYSSRKNGNTCDYVTAIVIHRIGVGARYFWMKDTATRKPNLREKIYTETIKSLQTAEALVPSLRLKLNGAKYELEIHVDVGPVGPTREMIREIAGMVLGSGYSVRTKPESWAASTVADKHT